MPEITELPVDLNGINDANLEDVSLLNMLWK